MHNLSPQPSQSHPVSRHKALESAGTGHCSCSQTAGPGAVTAVALLQLRRRVDDED